jgi:hypothetical protein
MYYYPFPSSRHADFLSYYPSISSRAATIPGYSKQVVEALVGQVDNLRPIGNRPFASDHAKLLVGRFRRAGRGLSEANGG